MIELLRPAISLFVLLSVITGIAYPVLTTAIATSLFKTEAGGSILFRDGKPIGSDLIAQNFTQPHYFWGRPSATTPQPNNGMASGGSNLGPLNPALVDGVKARIDALKAADPDNMQPIPVDLVTASASGLDPHISQAAARYQIPRVARARNMSVEHVTTLVERYTEDRQWRLFGEPRINVLSLNLALDAEH